MMSGAFRAECCPSRQDRRRRHPRAPGKILLTVERCWILCGGRYERVQWLVIFIVAVIVALWLFFRLGASGLVLDAVLIGALLVWQLGERKDA